MKFKKVRTCNKENHNNYIRDYNKNPVWNKGLTKETDERLKNISDKTRGLMVSKKLREIISLRTREAMKNPDVKERTIKGILKKFKERPTTTENAFIKFFLENNLPFNYCGDGSLIIGFKNPDFVENNGRKICLEVGNKKQKSIFHHHYVNWQGYEKERIEHFSKYGWKCLVLWDEELKNKCLLLGRVNNFLVSNQEVTFIKT